MYYIEFTGSRYGLTISNGEKILFASDEKMLGSIKREFKIENGILQIAAITSSNAWKIWHDIDKNKIEKRGDLWIVHDVQSREVRWVISQSKNKVTKVADIFTNLFDKSCLENWHELAIAACEISLL